jgi:hypothetical protein
VTTIVLGVLLLAALGVLVYRERENARERAALCDRIQAPAAASVAAMEHAIQWTPPAPTPDPFTDDVPPTLHNDLSIESLLEGA